MAKQRTTPKARRKGTTATGQAQANGVLAWEDDPGAPPAANNPVPRPVPELDKAPLPLVFKGRKAAPKQYPTGSAGFRFWSTAEALRRAADMWASLLPSGTTWFPSVGKRLSVDLDQAEDFNANYDRHGLNFFHGSVNGTTVYSAESPDVACHELGHAILDAIRPQLWDAASNEVAAFHESFGDMSALLTAMQLDSIRDDVLIATNGKVYRASRLSRLAEQLGWGIRQFRPDIVEPDCLRNAVNSFFYRDPATLPPTAPATQLSSEPHSFSRVFTASFLQTLAGMFALQERANAQTLLTVAMDAAHLLVQAARSAPVVPSYYSQVAAHMLAADVEAFGGRYQDALKSGFVAHGILSLESAVSLAFVPSVSSRSMVATTTLGMFATTTMGPATAEALPRIPLPATAYGLAADLFVHAASHPKVFSVAGAALDLRSAEPPSHDHAAASFVEDLFRRGRIDIGAHGVTGAAIVNPLGRKTHEVRKERDGLVLARRIFDCGFCDASSSYHETSHVQEKATTTDKAAHARSSQGGVKQRRF
jgi:hypothetical protein